MVLGVRTRVIKVRVGVVRTGVRDVMVGGLGLDSLGL